MRIGRPMAVTLSTRPKCSSVKPDPSPLRKPDVRGAEVDGPTRGNADEIHEDSQTSLDDEPEPTNTDV